MRSIDNPFRVVNRWLLNTQGSALARATLGWNLQTPSALVLHWNSRTSSALPWAGICKRLRRWSCTGICEPLRRCPGLEFANAFGVGPALEFANLFGVALGWNLQTPSALTIVNFAGLSSCGLPL